MKPQYREKMPIRRSRYLIFWKDFKAEFMGYSLRQSMQEKPTRIAPWKTSPNITPKRNGNVTIAKTAGLISLYYGTPYVLTIS
jgi:hypothetical protein